MLTVNLDLLPNSIAMYSGTTLPLALNAGGAQAQVAFTISSNNSDGLETLLTSGQDRSLRMNVRDYGTMEFQLFDDLTPNTADRIARLAEQGYYDGMAFHRVIAGFMAQGAGAKWNPQTNQYEPTTGTGSNIDEEFNRYLQFTAPGILAMANAGQAPSQNNSYVGRNNDSGDAQFFITDQPDQNRHLDFHLTIFGLLTSGDSIRQAITNADTNTSDQPTSPIIIDSMRVFSDTDSRVALLHSPLGGNGTYVVTVTADDGSGAVNKDITITVTSDPTGRNADSYLTTAGPFRMSQGVPYTFQLQGYDLEGNTITYGAASSNDSLTLGKWGESFDPSSGKGTLYPTSTLVGVYGIQAGSKTLKPNYVYWDTQQIPVFISPAAPSAVTLLTHTSDDWTTDRNNTADKKLQFHVTGVVPGAEVSVMADGTVIGTATVPTTIPASGGEIDVMTAGDIELQPGTHTITVRQTLKQQAVNVGNWNQGPVDLASPLTTPLTMTVLDPTAPPVFVTTPKTFAGVGYEYVYHPAANVLSDIALVSGPEGMAWDTSGGLRWTPNVHLTGTRQTVVLTATALGRPVSQQAFTIEVVTGPWLDPIGNQVTQQGSTLTLQAVGHGDSPLTYAIKQGPTAAAINPQTGLFVWAPTTDDATGQYVVNIEVVDAHGFNKDVSFEIQVLPATGDKSGVGVYAPVTGTFYLKDQPGYGDADQAFSFGPGQAAWGALSGDWNGNGVDSIGLYDPAGGMFYLKNTDDPAATDTWFPYGVGGQGWIPLVGDWDGNGTDTVGVYDPARGLFFLRNENTAGPADITFMFGVGGLGWQPISGNWDGLGGDTVGVYDPASSVFYLRNQHAPGDADAAFAFGVGGLGLRPLAGDWNGDGSDTVALYVPASGQFYLRNAHQPGDADQAFVYGIGGEGWQPLAGYWREPPSEAPSPALAAAALADANWQSVSGSTGSLLDEDEVSLLADSRLGRRK